MNSAEYLIKIINYGDYFQILGTLKYGIDNFPLYDSQGIMWYNDNYLGVDIAPFILMRGNEQEVVLYSTDKRLTFKMSLHNMILHGLCSIYFDQMPILVGMWKDGRKHGTFREYCYKSISYYGDYEQGVRTGYSNYPRLLGQTPSQRYFENGCEILIDQGTFHSIAYMHYYRYCYKYHSSLRRIDKPNEGKSIYYTYDEQTHAIHQVILKIEQSHTSNVVRRIKEFDGDQMLCYNQSNEIIYVGQYISSHPCLYVMHGNGSQYIHSQPYYKGSFQAGRRCGYGCAYYRNGILKYQGQWENDLPHGRGIYYDLFSDQSFEIECEHGYFYLNHEQYDLMSFVLPVLQKGIPSACRVGEEYTYSFIASDEFDPVWKELLYPTTLPQGYNLQPMTNTRIGRDMQVFMKDMQISQEEIPRTQTMRITVPSAFFPHTSWDSFYNLIQLVISDEFRSEQSIFCIQSVPRLQTIYIGSRCFVGEKSDHTVFQVIDCPRLTMLVILKDSFPNYQEFTINSRIWMNG